MNDMSLAIKLCLAISLIVWLGAAPPLFLLSSRLWKLPPINLRRSLLFATLLQAVGAIIFIAAAWLVTWGSRLTPARATAAASLAFFIAAAVETGLFAALPGAARIRGAAAWLAAMLTAGAAALGMAAFVRFLFLEGFIIPTGSMATTVIGAHADRQCENCGWPFTVNLSARIYDRGEMRDAPALKTFCPNCRHGCVISSEEPIRKGDRILADKANNPARWDLIVFRNPRDRSQKYLSRLTGLPNEQIEILGGEVFIDGKLLRKPPGTANDLWMHVHDTDFAPCDISEVTPQWRAGKRSRWKYADGRWKCTARPESARLEFSGPITDAVAYNAIAPFEVDSSPELPVGDVAVECVLDRLAGKGSFGLDWRFGDGEAQLRLNADGAVSIRARHEPAHQGVRDKIETASIRPPRPGDHVVFNIRDGQAYVEYAGELAALLTFGPELVAQQRARIEERSTSEPCELVLVAENCSVALSRIIVRRDVYYDELRADRGIGAALLLGSDEYFVLGDNNARSFDSRFYEGLRATDVIGVARCIYWPPSRWHALK